MEKDENVSLSSSAKENFDVSDNSKNNNMSSEKLETEETTEELPFKETTESLPFEESSKESEKKNFGLTDVKKIFGSLLVNLRRQKENMLLSVVGANNNVEIKNGVFVINVSDKIEYNTLIKDNNLKIINKIVCTLSGLNCKINYIQQVKTKENKIQEELLNKIGDILKIEE